MLTAVVNFGPIPIRITWLKNSPTINPQQSILIAGKLPDDIPESRKDIQEMIKKDVEEGRYALRHFYKHELPGAKGIEPEWTPADQLKEMAEAPAFDSPAVVDVDDSLVRFSEKVEKMGGELRILPEEHTGPLSREDVPTVRLGDTVIPEQIVKLKEDGRLE